MAAMGQRLSGFLPWHTAATVALVGAAFSPFRLTPATDLFQQGFGAEENVQLLLQLFSHRVFPDLVSLKALIFIRAVICIFAVTLSAYCYLLATIFDKAPILTTPYRPYSKLKQNVNLNLRGWHSQAPFTMWAWNLLALSFGLNAYLAYCELENNSANPVLARVALLVFEAAAPTALLVAFVVRYAIWPASLQSGTETASLKTFSSFCFHNLNAVLVLTEASLLGGIPVFYHDGFVAVWFGLLYVVFSWMIRDSWDPTGGPQYLYYFLDTTLDMETTIGILVLLAILLVFYGVFCFFHVLLDSFGGEMLAPHATFVAVISSLVCRFQD